MKTKKKILRNQKGFTLVEIIAVLVILGILAAVAIPKYFSLQADARNKAAFGAMANAMSQVNVQAAKYILNHSVTPTYAGMVADGMLTDYAKGDWAYDFGGALNIVNIAVTGSGEVAGATKSDFVELPNLE